MGCPRIFWPACACLSASLKSLISARWPRPRSLPARDGRPDSQEICFIPDGDYAAYIAARGLVPLQGRFIGPDGEDLGPHKGVWHYTVGQRKGLNIAYGTPLVRAAHPPERRRGACPRRR